MHNGSLLCRLWSLPFGHVDQWGSDTVSPATSASFYINRSARTPAWEGRLGSPVAATSDVPTGFRVTPTPSLRGGPKASPAATLASLACLLMVGSRVLSCKPVGWGTVAATSHTLEAAYPSKTKLISPKLVATSNDGFVFLFLIDPPPH